jgi:ethanolamine utilization microcompartment shell protein EutS
MVKGDGGSGKQITLVYILAVPVEVVASEVGNVDGNIPKGVVTLLTIVPLAVVSA